jgi:rhamnosyl/mannosyltransferase
MGGIETHLRALCGELRKSVQLRVLVAADGQQPVDELLDGVAVTRVPTWLTLASTPLCPGMIRQIRSSDADIVHIHLPNPMAVLAYLASGHCARLVITYHSDTIRQKILGTLFEPLLHQALHRSAAIIVTSPEYRRTSPVLARHLDRCHVIPYGIALEDFEHSQPEVVAKLRQQYGERVVISVGRLVYYKGFEYLIRAMTQVRGNLLIIGGGPLRGKLVQLAREIGVLDRVFFGGEIQNERVTPYYHAADVFALASIARSEAFGIVQIEAMAAALPVVNTRLDSGVPFVSLHQQTGLTVPPADPRAMATALNQLLDDAELRASLGNAARARARQEFSLGTMTTRTLDLYDAVMKSHPRH